MFLDKSYIFIFFVEKVVGKISPLYQIYLHNDGWQYFSWLSLGTDCCVRSRDTMWWDFLTNDRDKGGSGGMVMRWLVGVEGGRRNVIYW